jgi:hypothetical protein
MFRNFGYPSEAEAGLEALYARGHTTFEALHRRIQQVQTEWEPQNEQDELVVPFEGFFLIFTVAQEDSSVLILAAVEPQPRT